jgi:hypothetical protein
MKYTSKFRVDISYKSPFKTVHYGSCLCSLCGKKIYTNENAFLVNSNYVVCSEECVNMFILSRL